MAEAYQSEVRRLSSFWEHVPAVRKANNVNSAIVRLSSVNDNRPYHVSRTNSPRFAHWRLPKLTTKLGDRRGTPRDRPPQDDAPKIIHPTCEIDRFPHRVGFTREQRPPSRRSHRLDHHPARETGGPSRLPLPRRSGCQYCRSIQ